MPKCALIEIAGLELLFRTFGLHVRICGGFSGLFLVSESQSQSLTGVGMYHWPE